MLCTPYTPRGCKLQLLLRVLTLLALWRSVLTVPTDLSCEGVAQKQETMELDNCEFEGNPADTHIGCIFHAESRQRSVVQNTSVVLRFHTVFTVKKRLKSMKDSRGTWWCLGIASTSFYKTDEVPSKGTLFDFPDELAYVLLTVRESSVKVTFNGTTAVGQVLLRKDCKPLIGIPLDKSCVLSMRGASFVVAPKDSDFSLLDILFGRVKYLYFNTMGGVVQELTLQSLLPSTHYQSSEWLDLLGDINLKALNASHNNFPYVLPPRLPPLPQLRRLDFSDCHLEGINPENFPQISGVRVLDLSGNALPGVPAAIEHLRDLRSLNLSRQQVSSFSLELSNFEGLPQLQELRLASLPLIHISGSFPPLQHLEVLDMSSCGLESLTENVFWNLTSLRILHLENNLLRQLAPRTFVKLSSDAFLYLRRNLLQGNHRLHFNKLFLLDLTENQIRSPMNLVDQGRVEHLDISSNRVVNWTLPTVFQSDLHSISNVNISRNKIAVIDMEMGTSLKNITSVDIGGNPFDCQDCSLLEFKDWLNTTTSQVLLYNNATTPIKCVLPNRQSGQLLSSAQYNVTACEIPLPNYALVAGLPVGITLVVVAVSSLLFYVYRFEVTYMRHLLSVRRRKERSEKVGCEYDVFVSYSGKDREWVVDVLLPGLENHTDRYSVCLHERDFPLGSFIMDNIVSCIDQSRRVLLVLTPNYIESEWCKWELQMAHHRIFEDSHDFLILLELERLERDQLPLHLRVLMDSRTYLEWPGPPPMTTTSLQSFWVRLKQALGTALALSRQKQPDSPQEESGEPLLT